MNSREEQRRETSDWLVESALIERPINEVIQQFAERLLQSQIPVHRINCSTFQRHQIMGAVDTTWELGGGAPETEFVPKAVLSNENVFKTPAGALARSGEKFERLDLTRAESRAKFATLEDLSSRGYTDYFILKKSYERKWRVPNFDIESEGVYGSFATKQEGGFSDAQIEGIQSVWPHFSLYLKTSTERMLSAKLLEVYVGHLPAEKIIGGMTEHGDGSTINCALWYSDLRGSTRLSTSLPTDQYLELLNHYFECTLGSVIEQGGEVLKLIGDGVMAIFPFEAGDEEQACARALSAARQSLSKSADLRASKDTGPVAGLQFGIGLHIGEVVLGNVGISERLDMTVTGPSANQVTRLEALTKPLSLSVLASPQFFKAHHNNLKSIGKYPVPDLGGMTEIFTLIDE